MCCQGYSVSLIKLLDLLISALNISYRNTIQFTPTQIEAIRAGMQPGLTMVRTLYFMFLLYYVPHVRFKIEWKPPKGNYQNINNVFEKNCQHISRPHIFTWNIKLIAEQKDDFINFKL